MTCHCGRPDDRHDEDHRGLCCGCFDSEVLGNTFSEDPEYCATCDTTGESDDSQRGPTPT